jgi:protein-tyrosine kinase
MAIARRSLNAARIQAEPVEADQASAPRQDAPTGDATSPPKERGGAPSRSAIGLFRSSLARIRTGSGAGASPGVEEGELPHPPALRPMDLQKMGYVAPVYSLSRSVRLNPRVMSANRCVAFLPESPEVEFYRQLRTRILQISGGQGGATVMVTSALPGEGKTLTAINLALTFAKEFKQTALLVDCDLRQQQVHSQMGFASERGLVDYLMDDCPITELFVWPGVEKLSVISGGKTVRDSCELLGSPGMRDLVLEMKGRYPERYVFFDAPSILSSADAVAFAPLVDYILVVAQAGQTSLKDINRAVELLPPEKVLGLVMNRH